jgi:hypothetical protein
LNGLMIAITSFICSPLHVAASVLANGREPR